MKGFLGAPLRIKLDKVTKHTDPAGLKDPQIVCIGIYSHNLKLMVLAMGQKTWSKKPFMKKCVCNQDLTNT